MEEKNFLTVLETGLKGLGDKIDATHERLDGIDQRLDGMDRRFDGMDRRFDGMDRRFDGIDQRLDGMDQRIDGTNQRLETMDTEFRKRLDNVELSVHTARIQIEGLRGDVQLLAETIGGVDAKLERHLAEHA